MTSNHDIRAAVFDLGEVVLHVDLERTLSAWTSAGASADRVRDFYRTETEYRRFERGEIDAKAYHRILVDHVGHPLSFQAFLDGWNAMLGETIDGIVDLLTRLEGRLRLVALSNTNCEHEKIWSARNADALRYFERVFTSHDIGSRKPEPACFQAVLDYLALPAESVVMVDDRPDNIDAAVRLGMKGITATDPTQIARRLEDLGVDGL